MIEVILFITGFLVGYLICFYQYKRDEKSRDEFNRRFARDLHTNLMLQINKSALEQIKKGNAERKRKAGGVE